MHFTRHSPAGANRIVPAASYASQAQVSRPNIGQLARRVWALHVLSVDRSWPPSALHAGMQAALASQSSSREASQHGGAQARTTAATGSALPRRLSSGRLASEDLHALSDDGNSSDSDATSFYTAASGAADGAQPDVQPSSGGHAARTPSYQSLSGLVDSPPAGATQVCMHCLHDYQPCAVMSCCMAWHASSAGNQLSRQPCTPVMRGAACLQ